MSDSTTPTNQLISRADNTNLLRRFAPDYWKANLPVFPLYPRKKEPMLSGWREYSVIMPSEQTRNTWLQSYPHSNLGLALGPCSNIAVIDIDTDDKKLIKAIMEALPVSPWVRKGQKGMVLAYRFNRSVKTFRIRTNLNESVVEYLSEGTYVVLPPSIHPKTQQPYVENVRLVDLLADLPLAPVDIEDRLRKVLLEHGVTLASRSAAKVTDFVPAGSRDVSLTRMAGLFAFAVMRGERTLLEALEMLRAYAKNYIENVVGDAMPIEKHEQNLVRFLSRDVLEKKRILPEGWDSGLSDREKETYRQVFSGDNEEWPSHRVLEYLCRIFNEDKNLGGDKSMEAVEKILRKIAYGKNLNSLEVDRIFNMIVRESGLGLKASSLNKQVKEMKREDFFTGKNHTEIAQAMIEDLLEVQPIKYHESKFWRWCGSHWEEFSRVELEKEIHLRYGDCEANKKRSDTKGVVSTMEALLTSPLQEDTTEGINFANGYLTKDYDLCTHDPKYGCTYLMPFPMFPDGNSELRVLAPIFQGFLESCWHTDIDYFEKLEALQEAILITLFGWATRYQRAFLLFGVAESGKSQLLTIISSLVPDSAKSAVAPDAWADSFAPSAMTNKLLNIAGELSEEKKIAGQIFKEIVDGSEMTLRAPYGQPYTTRMRAAQWLAGNFLPKTRDSSAGFSRRWLIFEFSKPVAKRDRRPNLGEDIVNIERAGIVKWALGAMPRLMENRGLTLPKSHKTCVTQMSSLNNTVRAFLEAEMSGLRLYCYDLSQAFQDDPIGLQHKFSRLYSINEIKLYEKYWAWTLTNSSVKPVSVTEFRTRMQELQSQYGISSKSNAGIYQYDGVGISADVTANIAKVRSVVQTKLLGSLDSDITSIGQGD